MGSHNNNGITLLKKTIKNIVHLTHRDKHKGCLHNICAYNKHVGACPYSGDHTQGRTPQLGSMHGEDLVCVCGGCAT